ncbi:MAG: rRNA processing protein [Sclerophora amabilis]|nr:MAG: rRNA processing protein [Sclerophora amabilis]
MGASAKKKKEKRKDFQKPKLKVGKTKPKAANFTDTSFKSKAIVVNQQSLSTAAPTSSAQFSHHLSLLSSHSASQRRDSLAHLTTVITASSTLPLSLPAILPKLLPLIYDESASVRLQLGKLCRVLPVKDVRNYAERFVMHIRLGINWINPDVRTDTVDILSWLLSVAGDEVVCCSGGWAKILKCFLALFGWQIEDGDKKWSSKTLGLGSSSVQEKAAAKQLQVFGQFLQAGIGLPPDLDEAVGQSAFPYCDTEQHMLPQRSDCFKRLNLFGPPRDEDSQMYEERGERQSLLFGKCRVPVDMGLENARKHGGELGRVAAVVSNILREGMKDHQEC